MREMMKLRAALVLLAVALASVVTVQPATSSCVGPVVAAKPGGVERGGSFVLNGKYFFDGCNDVISCVAGRPCTPPPPPPPRQDIDVTMRYTLVAKPKKKYYLEKRFSFEGPPQSL
jgi:hypothetical protein